MRSTFASKTLSNSQEANRRFLVESNKSLLISSEWVKLTSMSEQFSTSASIRASFSKSDSTTYNLALFCLVQGLLRAFWRYGLSEPLEHT